LTAAAVIPGRRDSVEPGIHFSTERVVEWIPGPRQKARPGMTEKQIRRAGTRTDAAPWMQRSAARRTAKPRPPALEALPMGKD